MSVPAVRPRFSIEVGLPPDDAMARLRAALRHCPRCDAVTRGRHAELLVPHEERRVWSPWLSVSAEERPGGGTELRCRFGPHPALWTLYMFVAFGLGFAALVAAAWGYAQWAMDGPPWAAAVGLPAALLAGGGLYAVSVVGQRLGRGQMSDLRAVLEEHLGAPSEAAD